MSDLFPHYIPAGPEHSEEILSIIEEVDFKGRISLLYTRRPDAYNSLRREGYEVFIYICRVNESGRLVGFGACALTRMIIDGRRQELGYLFSFRIKKESHSFLRYLPEGYGYHFHLMKKRGVSFFLTTILEDNLPARFLLEKRRKSMPVYDYIGSIETISLKTGGKVQLDEGWSFCNIQKENIYELLEFYEEQGRRYQYFPVISEEDLLEGKITPAFDKFFVLRKPDGSIASAGAVWDQRDYKQYIVAGYRGLLRLLRPVSKFLFPLFGYPRLPSVGSRMNFFILAFLLSIKDDSYSHMKFIECILAGNTEYDSCSFGMHERNPQLKIVKQKCCIVYRSRLYRVFENPQDVNIFSGIPYVEIGRL